MEFVVSYRFSKMFIVVMSVLLVACGESDNSTNNATQAETTVTLPPKDKAINFYSADGEVIGTYMVKENGEIDKVLHPSAGYVADMAYKELTQKYGDNLHREILNVHTTVNIANQEKATKALQKGLTAINLDKNKRHYLRYLEINTEQSNGNRNNGDAKKGHEEIQAPIEGALVSIDVNTGEVLALVGGYDNGSLSVNRATEMKRNVADLFQPFVYASALEVGDMRPRSIVSVAPLRVLGKEYLNQGGFYGARSLFDTILCSPNAVSARLGHRVGVKNLREYATRFGFQKEQLAHDLDLTVGYANISPLEMSRAYSVFASGGYGANPYVIDAITDANNQIKEETKSIAKSELPSVIDHNVANIINAMLSNVAQKGCSKEANFRPDIAGISGASVEWQELWFVGYTPNVVTVVYMGYDEPKIIQERTWGENYALPVWRDYMQFALKDVPVQNFEKPNLNYSTAKQQKELNKPREVILTPVENSAQSK